MKKPDYGGAFDIDPTSFWTRDDLNELVSEVENDEYIQTLKNFRINESYITDNVIELEIMYNEEYMTITKKIDMRKIKSPNDLCKIYTSELVELIRLKCNNTA
jgi:hypothetical protein